MNSNNNDLSPYVTALVDCNNFFVSCERIFRPDLKGKPVVVLSSNDGCVVARSNEAKALGIPMGAPAYKYRQLFKEQTVIQFSANFELYGDISRRIVTILASTVPHTEVYSVDESFLDLSALGIIDYGEWGKALRQRLLQSIGVPVSIGIATTKTLAKLGADYAKKHDETDGVLDLVTINSGERQLYLANFPLGGVWGVGRRLVPKLHAEGIHNTLDLSRLRPRRARQLMGLLGLQTVSELNNINCHASKPLYVPHQTIMRGRTFGEDTNIFEVIEASIASLANRAVWQARSEHQLCRKAILSLNTSKHKPGYTSWYESVDFPMPTSDSGHIIKVLIEKFMEIYSNKQNYHRTSVILYDFIPDHSLQIDLLGVIQPVVHDSSNNLMNAVDSINDRYGHHKIYYAAEDLSKSWRPKHTFRSPEYVSNWDELPIVRYTQN